jgi:hypothetical protein
MTATVRLAFIAALALLVGVAGWYFLSRPVEPDGPMVNVIDGDPRMKLCESPLGVPYATPEVLAQLGISGPLALEPGMTGHYRITVFRPTGEPSVSVRMWTSASAPTRAEVKSVTGGSADGPRGDAFEVEFRPANTLILGFENARIWGRPTPIPLPMTVTGPGTAVIEIKAGATSRCVTTRYDDERVAGLLAAFEGQLRGYLRQTSMMPMVAPTAQMFGQDAPKGAR